MHLSLYSDYTIKTYGYRYTTQLDTIIIERVAWGIPVLRAQSNAFDLKCFQYLVILSTITITYCSVPVYFPTLAFVQPQFDCFVHYLLLRNYISNFPRFWWPLLFSIYHITLYSFGAQIWSHFHVYLISRGIKNIIIIEVHGIGKWLLQCHNTFIWNMAPTLQDIMR